MLETRRIFVYEQVELIYVDLHYLGFGMLTVDKKVPM